MHNNYSFFRSTYSTETALPSSCFKVSLYLSPSLHIIRQLSVLTRLVQGLCELVCYPYRNYFEWVHWFAPPSHYGGIIGPNDNHRPSCSCWVTSECELICSTNTSKLSEFNCWQRGAQEVQVANRSNWKDGLTSTLWPAQASGPGLKGLSRCHQSWWCFGFSDGTCQGIWQKECTCCDIWQLHKTWTPQAYWTLDLSIDMRNDFEMYKDQANLEGFLATWPSWSPVLSHLAMAMAARVAVLRQDTRSYSQLLWCRRESWSWVEILWIDRRSWTKLDHDSHYNGFGFPEATGGHLVQKVDSLVRWLSSIPGPTDRLH